MSEKYLRDPGIGDTTELVDWVEAKLIVEDVNRASRSLLRKYLSEIILKDDDPTELDVQLDLLLAEIERRHGILENQYPFEIYRTGVKARKNNSLAYIFLLCLSTSFTFRDENRQNQVESLLDYLILDALKKYFSNKSQGVHFGWPVTGDRPTHFVDAIEWLAKRIKLPVGVGKRRPLSKDGGVDVVVWCPFGDKREGFVTVLAQCTVKIDWFHKAKDITPDVWRGWIDFGKDPVTCLAIPFVVPVSYEKWDELRRTVSMVIDRLRICEMLQKIEFTKMDEIKEWTDNELLKMGGKI
jgi:hypothetical protein